MPWLNWRCGESPDNRSPAHSGASTETTTGRKVTRDGLTRDAGDNVQISRQRAMRV
jgi:hypothetical protein